MPARNARGQQDADGTYYSTPALKQKKFPDRRRSAIPKDGSRLTGLKRDQSTLTQMEFVSSPRAVSIVDSEEDAIEELEHRPKKKRKSNVSICSQEDDRDAEEWEAKQPAKRKKRKTKAKKQNNTLTQMEFVPSVSKMVAPDEDEGIATYEDLPPGLDGILEKVHRRAAARAAALPWLRQSSPEAGDENRSIAEASKRNLEESCSSEAQRLPSQALKADTQPKTPRRVHFLEVPSSQTPTDTKLSTERYLRTPADTRSPLHEKSVNSFPISPSPVMKTTLFDDDALSPVRRFEPVTIVPLNDANEPLPALERVTTIQDSEASPESERIPRKFARVNTVQDSQYEDLDLGSGPMLQEPDLDEPDNLVDTDSDTDDQEDFEGYDPACSALDRDAARYFQTQWNLATNDGREIQQITTTQPQDTAVPHETQPQKAGADIDAMPFSQADGVQPQNSQVQQAVKEFLLVGPTEATEQLLSDPCVVKPGAPSQRASQTTMEQCAHSSPPTVPPSQVSTVVDPTQPSARFSTRRTHTKPKSRTQEETLSSSPFPLPPWTSPEQHRYNYSRPTSRDKTNKSLGLQSLMDFSLPPPPPVSSWRRSSGCRSSSPAQ